MSGFAGDIGRAFSRMATEMTAEMVMLQVSKMFVSGAGGGNLPALSTAGGPTGMGYSSGGVFSGGRVVPFDLGGVVLRPTVFPMADGNVGLMGESGAEGVLPLKRKKSGKLGVETASREKSIIQNEVKIKAIVVDDRRKAVIESMMSEEGEQAIIMHLRSNGII
jgi:phage-related minor tail protein